MSDFLFSYKTRYGSSPEGKAKVFFTCHPDDFDLYFESVCNDIFAEHDCAIFYTENMNADISDENVLFNLERMNLFVIPVTFKLLTTSNRAMDIDFRFARDRHIPILPLLMEPGIYEFYKAPGKFGELQYLNPFYSDSSAIDYKKKLNKFLESVLFSKEHIQRIRTAFDLYVFLSYRKVDRQYANVLMKLIHDNPEFEGIAIWFDEFLTPGENFRENIKTVLKDSKLFMLLVTSNLLKRCDDGRPNFIMAEEYPMAKQLDIAILPVEMEKTDRTVLIQEFKDVPECSDVKDKDAFRLRLINELKGAVSFKKSDEPEHNYLIGLAYLKGIDVEVDVDRGIRLITKAGEAGHLEALFTLYNIYHEGNYVETDYKKALLWIQECYELSEKCLGEEHEDTLTRLSYLAEAYYSTGNLNKYVETSLKLNQICKRVYGENHIDTLTSLNNLAVSYSVIGKYGASLQLDEEVLNQSLNILGPEHPHIVYVLNNLAESYRYAGIIDKCLVYSKKCYALSVEVNGEKHGNTLCALNTLALAYREIGDYKKSLELSMKCYELRKKQFGEEHPDTINSLGNLAIAYRDVGDSSCLGLCVKCYDLFQRIYGDDHPETLRALSNLASTYRIVGDKQKGLEMQLVCYEACRNVLGEQHPFSLGCLNNLATAYNDVGDCFKCFDLCKKSYGISVTVNGEEHPTTLLCLSNLASAFQSIGNCSKSFELHKKCYELRKQIRGNQHPDVASSLSHLGAVCKKLGKYDQSYTYYKDCFELTLKIFGDRHPKTLIAITNFAISSFKTDKTPDNETIRKRCFELSKEYLGLNSPLTKLFYPGK